MKLSQNNLCKIYVAGHRGMVGSALVRFLQKEENNKIICKTHNELDLKNQSQVMSFFANEKFDQVYIAAAKVGGIYANHNFPAEFIYDNIMIQSNLIYASFIHGVKKILFLGSSCIYPKFANQPMTEEELLTGNLEPTNEPYAIAKIAGIKMCESFNRQYGISHGVDYRCIMPTNLYGPGDKYDDNNSHVIPALIKRFYECKIKKKKEIMIWGTGEAKREFLFVDDMARACVELMNYDKDKFSKIISPMCSHLNAGSGSDLSIYELAKTIAEIVGYKGNIFFDKTKPDGTPRKILNSDRLKSIGWAPTITLKEGLKISYEDFLNRYEDSK